MSRHTPRARVERLVRATACMAILTVLTGCALPDADARGWSGDPGQQVHEAAMNQQWKNRPLSQLVTEMGHPKLLLTIPGGGNPPGFAAIYGRDPATGCLDAFALVYARDPIIRSYYCR